MSRLRRLAAVPALLAVLTACGSDDLAPEDVAAKAEDALEKQVGARPDVTCPEALPAEVGATTRCTLTAGDDPTEYGVRMTVTSVDGEAVTFDVEVEDEPQK